MNRILLLVPFCLAATFSAHAQLANTTWAINGPTGQYFFDFIFQGDGVLAADIAGTIQPVATYSISGDTLTTIQSDPNDDCTTPGVYTFVITPDEVIFTLVSDACADRVFLFTNCTWTGSVSTSIETTTLPALSIHPNPSTGAIQLEHSFAEDVHLSIVDASGRIVHQELLQGPNSRIDLSQLPASIYMVTARTSTGNATHRLILH